MTNVKLKYLKVRLDRCTCLERSCSSSMDYLHEGSGGHKEKHGGSSKYQQNLISRETSTNVANFNV